MLLRLIALLKLAKGLLLLGAGVGALRLLHADVLEAVLVLSDRLNLDPQNRYVEAAIERLALVDAHTLRSLEVGSFVYAALLLTEGVGLWRRRHWAEYFTVVVTGSFVPLEAYELTRRFTAVRLVVLLLNVAIVAYLVRRIRSRRGTL
jgi:uncharacterized membrane protein (DUF2068 family)